ncbi:hypothetical protein OROGR_021620 [Orobanche gracilis]
MACESTSTSDDDYSDSSADLFTCDLCEEKFHMHCFEEAIAEDIDHGSRSFCGKECFEYTVRSLETFVTHTESNAVTFAVMDECFEPIIDERSGTNMIHNVVYSIGSNIRRLNYEGFYTIILEKGDEAVPTTSIS